MQNVCFRFFGNHTRHLVVHLSPRLSRPRITSTSRRNNAGEGRRADRASGNVSPNRTGRLLIRLSRTTPHAYAYGAGGVMDARIDTSKCFVYHWHTGSRKLFPRDHYRGPPATGAPPPTCFSRHIPLWRVLTRRETELCGERAGEEKKYTRKVTFTSIRGLHVPRHSIMTFERTKKKGESMEGTNGYEIGELCA